MSAVAAGVVCMQEDGGEYDPADVFGQWLDSALDLPMAKYTSLSTDRPLYSWQCWSQDQL